METIAEPISSLYSPPGETVYKILGAGISSLQLAPRPSSSPQESPSKTIYCSGIDKTAPRLYSLTAKPSNMGQAPNGTAVHTIGTHIPPRLPLNRHRLPTPKRGFDVTELPVEIICVIFEKFVEDDSQMNYNDSPKGPLISYSCRSDPTLLGRICSRWRTVAIDLPNLWSSILIYKPKPSQFHLANVWLERSGNKPLDLKIGYDGEEDTFDLIEASRILKSFCSRLESWRTIDFQMPLQFLGLLFGMVQDFALVQDYKRPFLLRRASIIFVDSVRYPYQAKFDPYIDVIWKFFHLSPNLSQVDWRGRGLNNFPSHAPFLQLTHVKTHFDLSVDDVLTFLAVVPRLQVLSVESIELPSETESDIVTPPLLLQHLRVLSVRSHMVRICSLFSSLMCPSLQNLNITHSSLTHQLNPYMSELIRCLQRSNCQLQTLELTDLNLSENDLEQHLPSPTLRSLTSLWITKNVVSDRIVRILMKKSEDGSHQFLPRLQRLFLTSCETTDGLLATMISSRWHRAESLPGALQWAIVNPRKIFGPIDGDFFRKHVFYR